MRTNWEHNPEFCTCFRVRMQTLQINGAGSIFGELYPNHLKSKINIDTLRLNQ
jgi:hypothetical protein